jgi:hypothetical protein
MEAVAEGACLPRCCCRASPLSSGAILRPVQTGLWGAPDVPTNERVADVLVMIATVVFVTCRRVCLVCAVVPCMHACAGRAACRCACVLIMYHYRPAHARHIVVFVVEVRAQ